MAIPPLKRILYAEVEPVILEIALVALREFGGFDVACCTSGVDVFALANTFEPDLILLDVRMPDVDGPTALKKLRTEIKFQTTPVIFMTATDEQSEIDSLKELGAIDVISKPFNVETLSDDIQSVWDLYHA